MISHDAFPVYAQYNEDIIIAALLHKISKGFYVDIGANDEEYHSVTKYFYNKGWQGINVDPIPRFISEFNKKRKRDKNLQIGVSSKAGKLRFREYPEHDGLSTLNETSKRETDKHNLPFNDYDIEVKTLKDIFVENKVANIDFVKIDVEGYELEVLRGNDWDKYRPSLVCIEANHAEQSCRDYLKQQKYQLYISDGLNEYYIADEYDADLDTFAERATLLAHNAIRNHHYQLWSSDVNELKKNKDLLNEARAEIEELRTHNDYINMTYSFKDKTFMRRLKLAVKSLTKDYLRYKGVIKND